MPLVDPDLQSTWDEQYDYAVGGEPWRTQRVRLGYFGPVLQDAYKSSAAIIDAALGGGTVHNQRVVMLGASYGYTVFELSKLGFINITAVETSSYIQSTKGDTWTQQLRDWITAAEHNPDGGYGLEVMQMFPTHTDRRTPSGITLVDEDISTISGRAAIASAAGGNPDIIITESILEWLSDAGGQMLTNSMQAFDGVQKVVHSLYVRDPAHSSNDTKLNFKKALTDWDAAITGVDVWLDLGSDAVLVN